jgi:hypothetical protein
MHAFTNTIESTNLNFQNIETKLKLSLENLIGINDKKILKIYTFTESQKLIRPYLDLILYYANPNQEETYEQIVPKFLERYEIFTEAFTSLIKKNAFNKIICCTITHAWLEILAGLEKEGKTQSDMLARSISAQMQTDLVRILESLVNLS